VLVIFTSGGSQLATGEVLLVEDDTGDALLLEELLKAAGSGLTTVRASSLSEMPGLLSAQTVCILMDLRLPDSQGLDGLRQALGFVGAVPIVVLTGLADRTLGQAAVSAGAQDYLMKGSVDGESLTRAIRYAIERKLGEQAQRRLREAELAAAEQARLERGLLPRPIIANPSVRWATRYRPGGQHGLLGGDFFDGIELPDGSIRVLIGDVSGHGPDEAAVGVALRVAWRALVLAGCPPDSLLGHLQTVLKAEGTEEHVFATVCDLTVDRDLERAELRLGGHPAPLLVHGERIGELPIAARGPVLGVVPDPVWPTAQVELGSEWTLILFTDGIIEARGRSGQLLDTAGLVELAADSLARGRDLDGLADDLIAGAETASEGPLRDDVALFILATEARWRD
jgi:serine phosphatase RsbU (regulator of sigma subunit)